LITTIIGAGLGLLWYGPLFGPLWMKVRKIGPQDLNKARLAGMGRIYAYSVLSIFVMNYVLAHFLVMADATTIGQGIITGFWLWLGFVATTHLINTLYDRKSIALYQINVSYHLAQLIISGALLSVWS
jgi:hypothetical protein